MPALTDMTYMTFDKLRAMIKGIPVFIELPSQVALSSTNMVLFSPTSQCYTQYTEIPKRLALSSAKLITLLSEQRS